MTGDRSTNSDRTPPKYVRLPICDLLYCLCSLSLHLISILFAFFAAYRLKTFDYFLTAVLIFAFAATASLATTVTSLVWYFRNSNGAFRRTDLGLHLTAHLLQLTLVWRHYALFRRVPEHLTKFLFCELLILRLLHAAVFSLPCCLALLFTLFHFGDEISEIERAVLAAAVLTLIDFCWSLASFNRRTNRSQPEALTLSWPGVLCQLVWRCGTVGARCVALAAFASYFLYLTAVVVGLHWLLMAVGLILFTAPTANGLGGRRWLAKCILLGAVYIICFYNPQKEGVKWRCVAFYGVMLVENSFLLTLRLLLAKIPGAWIEYFAVGATWGAFAVGILAMLVYYKYLHVTKLKAAVANGRSVGQRGQGRDAGSFVCRLAALPTGFRSSAINAKDESSSPPQLNQSPTDGACERNGRHRESTTTSEGQRERTANPTRDSFGDPKNRPGNGMSRSPSGRSKKTEHPILNISSTSNGSNKSEPQPTPHRLKAIETIF